MSAVPWPRSRIIVLLLVCVLFSLAFAYLLTQQPQVLVRSDYFARWYATQKLATEGRNLYDSRNGVEVDELNGLPADPVAGNFFYPPYVAALILPLVWAPYPLAHFIWLTAVQLFLVLGLLWVACLERWPRSANFLALFVLLALFFIPNLQNTIWGQFNTLSVISLSLVYRFLRRQRYVLAGLAALGLMLKPQAMLLALVFLLIWGLSERRRWPFVFGFALSGLAAWAFAEWIEPGWVPAFLDWLHIYTLTYHPQGVWAGLGWAGSALNLLWLAAALALFVWNRSFAVDSVQFAGTLVFGLCAWWMVSAVLGMMHLAALPLALIWLFANLEQTRPALYRFSLPAYAGLYILGLAGFLYGLAKPELYGLHITLSELAYKVMAPLLTAFLAIPLCFAGKSFPNLRLYLHKEAI